MDTLKVFPISVLSHRNISDVFAKDMSFDMKMGQSCVLSNVSMLNTVHIRTEDKGCGKATLTRSYLGRLALGLEFPLI